MKSFVGLVLISFIFFPSLATSAELVVSTRRAYDAPGRGLEHTVDSWETDAGEMTQGQLAPVQFDDLIIALAMAPDHTLYYVANGDFVPVPDHVGTVRLPEIRRAALSVSADGEIARGPEEVVYVSTEPASIDDYYQNLVINDIAVREVDDEGNYRVYFSTGGCGACEAEGRIYYLDEDGTPEHYYTIPRDDIEVSSCEGLSGHWSGNFDFDDDGELYLSSGNHCPSGLFHVGDAGPDRVRGDPIQIYELPCGILHFLVDTESDVYFLSDLWDRFVYKANMDSYELGDALEFTTDILDPPIGDAARILVDDFDHMTPLPYHTSGRPSLMRGPSMADRAFSLPGSGSTASETPPTTIMAGALSERLMSIPLPDTGKLTADLRIVGLEAGEPEVSKNLIQLPLRVFLRNQGKGTNRPFKLSVRVAHPDRKAPLPAAYRVAGQNDQRMPTLKQLGSNEVVALGGVLSFKDPTGRLLKEGSITVIADVDSCLDQPGGIKTKPECRVPEDNERNNRMEMRVKL